MPACSARTRRCATIGSVFAMNASGPRRVFAGAARDHLIGIKAVTGTGEMFKSGGRVMKNVTGYDLVKGIAGSWGTLALLTEVTFKVVPMPPAATTIVLLGLLDEIAVEALCAGHGHAVRGVGRVHLQQSLAVTLDHSVVRAQGKAITALRLEGLPASLAYRRDALARCSTPYGKRARSRQRQLARRSGTRFRRLGFFGETSAQIWRISTAPTKGPKVVEALQRYYADARLLRLVGRARLGRGGGQRRRRRGRHPPRRRNTRRPRHLDARRAVRPRRRRRVPAARSRRAEALASASSRRSIPAGILNPGRMTTAF